LEDPYDKVIAIEAFLRGYPYNERIPGPKLGQDGVDYFLFEERQGYCTYYASAMVVMLRVVGVPARYVEGYNQAYRDAGVYHVLEKDGHAWPEVYFPKYGWVEFEPTSSKSPTVHTPQQKATEDEVDSPERFQNRPRFLEEDTLLPPLPTSEPVKVPVVPFWRRVKPWTWGTLGGLLALAAVVGWLVLLRRRHVADMSAIERAYYDLTNWAGRLLGLPPLAHQTPHEYALAAGDAVPAGREAIGRIADLYVDEKFGARQVSWQQAAEVWRKTWPALVRRGFQRALEGARRAGLRVITLGGRF
jgi:hypothetical protein